MRMKVFREKLQRLGVCVQNVTARKLSLQLFLFVISVLKINMPKVVYSVKVKSG
jgi:hypothetical protein